MSYDEKPCDHTKCVIVRWTRLKVHKVANVYRFNDKPFTPYSLTSFHLENF